MTEHYRGGPEQQKITRVTAGGSDRRYEGEAFHSAFSRKWARHTEPLTVEELHTTAQEITKHFRPVGEKGALAEIRELLRNEAREKQIDEFAAMRAKINDAINQQREKIQRETQERGGKISVGQLVFSLLDAVLSTPAAWAEQSVEDAKQQAEQAA